MLQCMHYGFHKNMKQHYGFQHRNTTQTKRECGKMSAKWVALNTSPVLSETDECESDNALLCWLLHVSWQFAI